MNDEIQHFLLIRMSSFNRVDFEMIYVDMTDDLEAGLLLSQIVYWHLPSKENNQTKLRIKKGENLWLAKGREDWYEEIRLKPKRVDKAMKILIDLGIIEKKTFKFNANPTVHVRLVWDRFLSLYNEKLASQPLSDMVFPKSGKRNFPNREKGISQIGKKEFPESGKTLTEITNKDYQTNNKEIVNKELALDIFNSFYNDYSIGRWSKKEWLTIANQFISEKDWTSIKNPINYIEESIKAIAYKHDMKHKKIDSNENSITDYNWLEDDNFPWESKN